MGVLVLRGTGWQGGAVLAAFFISSNLVSRVGPRSAPAGLDPKRDRRDLWQVYANGGAAALGAGVGLVDHALGIWLVTSTLAAAAADTWATSIGSPEPGPASPAMVRAHGAGRNQWGDDIVGHARAVRLEP